MRFVVFLLVDVMVLSNLLLINFMVLCWVVDIGGASLLFFCWYVVWGGGMYVVQGWYVYW